MTDFILDNNGVWNREIPVIDDNGDEGFQFEPVTIVDVPVTVLLEEWEDLVLELSQKEVEYFKLKEYYESESHHLETTVDFKELYGKNNADVRKHHIKVELSDVYDKMKDLEFSIDYITRRISYLKELIRTKRLLIEVKEYE